MSMNTGPHKDDGLAQVAAADPMDLKVSRTQLSILFDQLPQGLIATVVNSSLMAWVLLAVQPQAKIMAWTLAVYVMCAVRFATLRAFRRENSDAFDVQKWRRLFLLGSTATALAWGTAGAWLFPDSSYQHQAFIGFVLAGMAAGASGSMAADDKIYRIYLALAIMPYLMRLVIEGHSVSLAMAAMCLAFIAAMSLSAAKNTRAIVESMRLRFLNQDLLIELSRQTEESRRANASLTQENEQRQKTEAALLKAMDEVQASARTKSQFLANMSHEIRTPMNGVFGMTDLLMRTDLDARQQKLLGTINDSAKSLLTIINDILDISRIESGKLELDIHEFSVRDVVERSTDLFSGQVSAKGIDLSVYIDNDVPLFAKGDSGRIKQILLNLIGNSLKFTKYGEIAVRVTRTGGTDKASQLCFEVRDTGIGIDSAVRDKLFQPFTQAETSISRRFGGTGLGLSISRHLVELMGGSIDIESELGKGTRVSFHLALDHGDIAKVKADGDPGVLDDARILVIDDRDTNREIIANYLSASGCKVALASSAAEAWPMLTASLETGKPFHAAIVDMVMPEENGIEFAARIKAHDNLSRIKVIIATSLNWQGDLASIRDAGIETILTKPIRRDELVGAVARAISGNRHPGWSLKRPASNSDDAAAESPEKLEKHGAPILLVEDNEVNIEVARELLAAMGCHVQVARNGLEAVAQFNHGKFALILMDCQMPIMDGLAATRRIREIERAHAMPRIPIVAMTANAYAEDRTRCIESGMDDYLSKPYTENQLRAALKNWLTPPGESAKAEVRAIEISADTACATHESENAVIDDGVISPLRTSRPDLFKRLIATYLNYAPSALIELRSALESDDLTTLGRVAHSLKSSSANLGATQLSKHCRDLEMASRDQKEVNVAPLVASIESAFADVAAALNAAMPASEPDKALETGNVRTAS